MVLKSKIPFICRSKFSETCNTLEQYKIKQRELATSYWLKTKWQEYRVSCHNNLQAWCVHPSSITSLLSPYSLTQYWIVHSQNCCCLQMHLNKHNIGPLMCVSLSESLVLDGWLREGGAGGNGEIFLSISRVLVPLADTLPLCHYSQNAVFLCACVSIG